MPLRSHSVGFSQSYFQQFVTRAPEFAQMVPFAWAGNMSFSCRTASAVTAHFISRLKKAPVLVAWWITWAAGVCVLATWFWFEAFGGQQMWKRQGTARELLCYGGTVSKYTSLGKD